VKPLVLVVDDEKDILRAVEDLLWNSGFEVTVANGAEKAIRAFDAAPRKPDLLLTDVVMPGMSGPMLAEKLKEKYPALRVVFMSGYDHSHVVRRYVIQQGYHLIPKPFALGDLKSAIQTALQESATAQG
jgi:two-component system cell cycle sensor histidine kinase/response regulator CckA